MRVKLELLLKSLGFSLESIHRFSHEFINLVELAREAIDEFFLLIAHFVGSQVSDVFDILAELGGQLSEELVRLINLFLQVLFGTTHSVKDLRSELLKVVFKANKVALHVVKVLFV